MTRHMFAGAVTPEGFVSFYKEVLPANETKKTIIIKGPSGSGKSTFMKKLAAEFNNAGHLVEHLHCSNDVNSLDGVNLPTLCLYIFDGTAPHNSDPTLHMAEQIFNVGDFIDEGKALDKKETLLSLQTEKSSLNQRAVNYLKSAYNVYLNNTHIYEGSVNTSAIYKKSLELLTAIPLTSSNGPTKNQRFFASAITPDGLKNFANTLLTGDIYTIHARDGMGADLILSDIQLTANKRGFDTESFYCPLKPSKIEHLIIPELNLSYTTSNQYHTTTVKTD